MKRILPFLLLLLSCTEPVETSVLEESSVPAADTVVETSTIANTPLATDRFPENSPKDTFSVPPPALTTLRDSIPVFARQYLGAPYIYAMSDPEKGFDCSGFIYYVYQHFGINVPRSSIEYKTFGREVSLAQAQTADLILFTGVQDTDRIGHIGIILQNKGDSTPFIHASSGKEMAVIISSAATPGYRKRFVKVVDVIGTR